MYKTAYQEEAPDAIKMWDVWDKKGEYFYHRYWTLDSKIRKIKFKNLSSGAERSFLIEQYDG